MTVSLFIKKMRWRKSARAYNGQNEINLYKIFELEFDSFLKNYKKKPRAKIFLKK